MSESIQQSKSSLPAYNESAYKIESGLASDIIYTSYRKITVYPKINTEWEYTIIANVVLQFWSAETQEETRTQIYPF